MTDAQKTKKIKKISKLLAEAGAEAVVISDWGLVGKIRLASYQVEDMLGRAEAEAEAKQ